MTDNRHSQFCVLCGEISPPIRNALCPTCEADINRANHGVSVAVDPCASVVELRSLYLAIWEPFAQQILEPLDLVGYILPSNLDDDGRYLCGCHYMKCRNIVHPEKGLSRICAMFKPNTGDAP